LYKHENGTYFTEETIPPDVTHKKPRWGFKLSKGTLKAVGGLGGSMFVLVFLLLSFPTVPKEENPPNTKSSRHKLLRHTDKGNDGGGDFSVALWWSWARVPTTAAFTLFVYGMLALFMVLYDLGQYTTFAQNFTDADLHVRGSQSGQHYS
jgi:hypothetical protein